MSDLTKDMRNMRLAVDNKWNAVKQLETLEARLRKAGDPHQANDVLHLRRQLERLSV